MPTEAEEAALRRLSDAKLEQQERSRLTAQIQNLWNRYLSNVGRSCPRVPSDRVRALFDGNDHPSRAPDFELPGDLCWGTDQQVNGRAFVFLSVVVDNWNERGLFVVYEAGTPTFLPLCQKRLAGAGTLFSEGAVVDYPGALRSLIELYRNGSAVFESVAAVGEDAAGHLRVSVSLQYTKRGFAPNVKKDA